MDKITNLFWEVGSFISKGSFKTGESLESPVLKSHDGESWWLKFYPAGDDDNPDSLVFWLHRNNDDKQVHVSFEIQFCFYTAPVRVYNLHHTFEIDEDVHKWVVDDVKNLAQLKIFIPPSGLCFVGYLKVHDKNDDCKTENLHEINRNFPIKNSG